MAGRRSAERDGCQWGSLMLGKALPSPDPNRQGSRPLEPHNLARYNRGVSAVVFDTLILSRKLAAAGMPTEQAQGVAAAIAETLGEQIATRRDLQDVSRDIAEAARAARAHADQVEAKLTARIDQVEAKLSTRVDQVEAALSARIDQVDAKLTAQIDQVEAKLSAEIRQSEQRQTIRLGAMLTVVTAAMATLVKLL